MKGFSWKIFLRKYSLVLIECGLELQDFCQYSIGATEEEIAATEARLRIKLPPSYRDFLRVSNGWPHVYGGLGDGGLEPVCQIDWLRSCDPSLIEYYGDSKASYEEHLHDQGTPAGRYIGKYLESCLAIGRGDACAALLCPEVMTPEGEWEFWILGSWLPGADRWLSFQDWMIHVFQFHIDCLIYEGKRFESW